MFPPAVIKLAGTLNWVEMGFEVQVPFALSQKL